MKKLIIGYLCVLFLFNLSGCSSAEEEKIMLRQSDQGMTFHGINKSKALEVIGVLKKAFPELGKTKIVSIKFDNLEKTYFIVPEHYIVITSAWSSQITESYLVASDLSWVEYQKSDRKKVKRVTKISKNI